ncbi:MAG TPA: aldo/keto reductase [Terriglobales bacterium]|nr:aldo/keto reductase [Terriglobales bacterium]
MSTSPTEKISASAAGTITLDGELTVNRMGFGAMRITGPGIWGPPQNHAEAIRVLRRAVELGVNFIDTADSYGPYVSEELIAEALHPYSKGLVIATKGGWERVGPNQWIHNAFPDHLREAIDGSLKRLKLERIDVYQLHIPDPRVSLEKSIETLVKAKEQGKIRLIALSNVTREHIERALKLTPIASVQNRYNFDDREWDYVVDFCEDKNIAFIPWGPLAQGRSATAKLKQIAEAHGVSPMQVALAWLLQRSKIMLPIPGTSSVSHLEEDIAASSLKLKEDEWDDLAA